MPRPSRPLYLMLKPPPAVRQLMHALPWTDRQRAAELLHVTMLELGDASDLAPWMLNDLLGRLGTLTLPPFRVIFDRVVADRRRAILLPAEPLPHVIEARRAMIAALGVGAAVRRDPPFRPHVTLHYRSDAIVDHAIHPIAWQVDDIVLVESVIGSARHIEHGRVCLLPAPPPAHPLPARTQVPMPAQ